MNVYRFLGWLLFCWRTLSYRYHRWQMPSILPPVKDLVMIEYYKFRQDYFREREEESLRRFAPKGQL